MKCAFLDMAIGKYGEGETCPSSGYPFLYAVKAMEMTIEQVVWLCEDHASHVSRFFRGTLTTMTVEGVTVWEVMRN